MMRCCDEHGVALAPHGKTTMAPQLFADQLAAGAWGITAATVGQAQVMAHFGVERILIANEVLDRRAIRWLAIPTGRAEPPPPWRATGRRALTRSGGGEGRARVICSQP
jgi:D-serine deaminase-like pyridoxal phosphate-dependent protein